MFVVMDISWSKWRRNTVTRDQEVDVITDVTVDDFQKIDKHRTQITATLNGETKTLVARVYARETYEILPEGGFTTVHLGWGVQGTDHEGNSIVLRYVE